MKFKVLCSDLDGTLLSTKSDVSDFTISEFSRIKDKTRIILVSARMPKSMTYLQERLNIQNQPIICYNGALILDNLTEVFSSTIDISQLDNIRDLALKHSIKLGLYHKDEWYVEEDSERVQKEINYTNALPVFQETNRTILEWKKREIGAHKVMLMGNKDTTDSIFSLLQRSLGTELHFYRSNDTLIEVAPKSVSKLSGIKLLLKKEEALEDVIAFGDNYNDLEMLRNTGYGVAVENAREEVKKAAKHITLKNTEHGVAHFIRQNLFI